MTKSTHVVHFPTYLYEKVQRLAEGSAVPCSAYIFLAVEEYIKVRNSTSVYPAPAPTQKTDEDLLAELDEEVKEVYDPNTGGWVAATAKPAIFATAASSAARVAMTPEQTAEIQNAWGSDEED